ncbi:MAG: DnaD domain protein [Peptoniphilus sp.]|nr:DnaD domain protein [Peptoniphilus sp.]
MGYDMDVVLKACERCINISNPNIGYVDRILRSWHEKGIKKSEDIALLDKKPVPYKKTKFHNFKQQSDELTEEELEELAREKREALFKKLGD